MEEAKEAQAMDMVVPPLGDPAAEAMALAGQGVVVRAAEVQAVAEVAGGVAAVEEVAVVAEDNVIKSATMRTFKFTPCHKKLF